MRYIPSSPYTLDEIAAQCRAAINRSVSDTQQRPDLYDEVHKYFEFEDVVIAA